MLSDSFQTLEFDCSWAHFRQLPRHPAYRYEYRRGRARISPRPQSFHCTLNLPDSRFILREQFPPGGHPSLGRMEPRLAGALRRLLPEDWDALPELMSRCFALRAPLGHLNSERQRAAARTWLERARTDADGPFVSQASFVIARPGTADIAGAILVTLIPDEDVESFDAAGWATPPPSQPVQRRWGRPHLTWIFVDPAHRRRRMAETLLHAAVRELDSLNYHELLSTFLWGDCDSLAWHWRMGFRLLSHPHSPRRVRPAEDRWPKSE